MVVSDCQYWKQCALATDLFEQAIVLSWRFCQSQSFRWLASSLTLTFKKKNLKCWHMQEYILLRAILSVIKWALWIFFWRTCFGYSLALQIGSRQYIVMPGRYIYTQRLKGANVNDQVWLFSLSAYSKLMCRLWDVASFHSCNFWIR
jgi:hypothetical protein